MNERGRRWERKGVTVMTHVRVGARIAAALMAGLLLGCPPGETGPDTFLVVSDAGGTDLGGPRHPKCGDLYYDEATDACVSCLSDDHCELGVCHPTENVCLACVVDDDCGLGVCHREHFVCVQCQQDADCKSGECNAAEHTCLGCGGDAECEDGNPCTTGRCMDKVCEYEPAADGEVCDGGPCTLDGACLAAQCMPGPTDPACLECSDNGECSDGEWCARHAGMCDGVGTCLPRPQECGKVAEPVCGCDGQQYGNPCLAGLAGVVIAAEQACCVPAKCTAGEPFAPEGSTCPTECPCKTNEDCDGGEVCARESCKVDVGECVPSPEPCPNLVEPVCGCGKATFDNSCFAAVAGVPVESLGKCCVPPVCPNGSDLLDLDGNGCAESCECSSTLDCPDGEVCPKACGPKVSGCVPCDPAPATLCACTGETLASECEVAAAGTSVLHGGSCELCQKLDCPHGGAPKDTTGDGCDDACVCDTAAACVDGAVCTAASCDGPTICAPCVQETGPMCGCDATTYENACAAHSSGTPIAHAGVCSCTEAGQCGPGQYCELDGCGGEGKCVSCDLEPLPVCGCDQASHADACAAKEAGALVASSGTCPGECKVLDCAPGFVARDTLDDDDLCPDTCLPVCEGVCECYAVVAPDGACDAGQRHWSCELGACYPMCSDALPEAVLGCPGPAVCDVDAQCGPLAFCKYPLGECGGLGKCDVKPATDACASPVDQPQLQAVCGCAGNTYDSECAALAAGESIADVGICCVPAVCEPGSKPGDLEGNGCLDDCLLCPKLECPDNAVSVDSDFDGCDDVCELQCPPQPVCAPPKIAADTSLDGCVDACVCPQLVTCPGGFEPSDSDLDGCDDICKALPCVVGEACGDASLVYCATAVGACGGGGVCATVPTSCLGVEAAPVCTCTGLTLDSACVAAQKGLGVLHEGACVNVGAACKADAECALASNELYCQKASGICDDGLGKCAQKALDTCPVDSADDQVVCGCDSQSYTNACKAHLVGVNVAFEGKCIQPTQECQLTVDCVSSDGISTGYCEFTDAACGGLGMCTPIPTSCVAGDVQPVCGCDGQEYESKCQAAKSGVSVHNEGKCDSLTP